MPTPTLINPHSEGRRRQLVWRPRCHIYLKLTLAKGHERYTLQVIANSKVRISSTTRIGSITSNT